MRIREGILGLVLVLSTAVPPLVLAQSNEGGIASDIANEKAIRALFGEFAAAWNRHDYLGLANMWASDGDHMEPDGAVAKGREADGPIPHDLHLGACERAGV